jgi:hypothetical protein
MLGMEKECKRDNIYEPQDLFEDSTKNKGALANWNLWIDSFLLCLV